MKPEISIIVPGIRPHNWEKLYQSVCKSTKREFELIFVGPFEPPLHFRDNKNIKYVKDWGSPARTSQIGAVLAEGKYITWAADDGVYLEGTLDRVLDLLIYSPNKYKVVVGKYYEGDSGILQPDKYFTINGSSWTSNINAKDNWWLFNIAIMTTEFFEILGGWDAENFETTFYAHTDLAMRAQMHPDTLVYIIPEPILNCTHMPERTGDHGPVHEAHTLYDFPLFMEIYNANEIFVPKQGYFTACYMENWKDSPMIWEKRFGK